MISIRIMTSFQRYRRSIGFTFVEILIVIVVLGILATIVTVSYNGVTKKSRNTQTGVVIQKYVDALVVYYAKYGKYPDGNPDSKTCLGIGYPGGKCWKGEIDENATFMQSLKNIAGADFPMTANQSLGLKGAWFKAKSTGLTNVLDGQPEDFVVYSVEGANTRCPVGPLASDGGDTNIFTYSSTPPASGQTHPQDTGYAGDPPQCWIPLSLVK